MLASLGFGLRTVGGAHGDTMGFFHRGSNRDMSEEAEPRKGSKLQLAISLAQGNYTLDVQQGGITIKADLGKIAAQAMESIELKVGGNSVKIDQSGVTIKGIMVKLEGEGMVQAKGPMVQLSADAMLTAKGGITKIG